MRFGPVPLDEAEGAVLAHTQRLPGGMLRKGSVLDATMLMRLREAGQERVVVARLDPGDVGEEDAAVRLGAALAGPGLLARPPANGRVNLVADAAGLLRVDAARLDALNEVDEALTAGTLPDFAAVAPEAIAATLKVIPFAVPGRALARVEALARAAGPILALHPFRPLRAGLVMTRLPGLKESVLAATAEATAARVQARTGALLPPLTCAHETGAIRDALRALMANGAELLLIAGASAVVDRHDVGPAGIVAAGGRIERFGMPVDPGNLICVGAVGPYPALVLPGCARSPALNGIDFALNRVFAGLPLDAAAISHMGVGGLLKDVGARPMPRSRAARPAAPRRVAAVVLAAGRSSRMAPRNKLLLPGADGTPMVARVVDAALASRARPVLVVVGNEGEAVRRAMAGRDVRVVEAADFAAGLSASLRAGIAAVPADAAGAVVCLGDMPLVGPEVLDALIAAHDAGEGRGIVVPTWRGKPGNPVLWDRRFFPELMALAGDMGGRGLLERHAEQVAPVEVGSDSVLRDFDTVESLAGLPEALRPAPEHLAAEGQRLLG
jgi:molybdenum cofactor cytidylyltransferase